MSTINLMHPLMGYDTFKNMQPIKATSFICILDLIILVLPAMADAFCMPAGETGKIPATETLTSRLEFNNDSYTIYPVDDWDDLRTFGFYSGISAKKWIFELTAESLTDRSRTIADSGRIDEFYGIISRELFQYSKNVFSVELGTGGGILILGDFDSYKLQQGLHRISRCVRPTPDAVTTPAANRICIGNGTARLALDTPIIPVAFAGACEAGHTGLYRVSAFFALEPVSGFIRTRFYGGFVKAGNYDGQGKVFEATLDSENGLYAGTVFAAGRLETGFSYNFTKKRQGGYAALSFGGEKEKRARTQPEHIRCIDFRLIPLYGSIRLRRSVMESPAILSPVFGAESGPMTISTRTVLDTDLYRYELYYLGLECAFDTASWLELYLMAGAGIRKEEWKTALQTQARLIDSKVSAVGVGEAGLRFFMPRQVPPATEWGLGTSLVVHYSNALVPGFCPFFQLYLIGESGRNKAF